MIVKTVTVKTVTVRTELINTASSDPTNEDLTKVENQKYARIQGELIGPNQKIKILGIELFKEESQFVHSICLVLKTISYFQ